MTVCTYFLKGQCRYGDKCRNEHPAGQAQRGFANQSWNRAPSSSNNTNNALSLFTVDSIKNDLTPQQEKPLWPLSSYGVAKYETNLVSGLDESFEELRCKAASAIAAGNINQYMQYETDKINQADKSISDARNNIQQAYDQAVKQSNVASMLNNSTGGSTPTSSSNALSTNTPALALSSSNTSAFGSGAPSAFGSSAAGSAFGRPSFGQSTFGQASAPSSSALGQAPQSTSVFGQATPAPSAFQSQTPQSNSVFGQSSQPSSVFGQSSQPASSLIKPATSGAFGAYANSAPSAFGAGAPPNPNTTSGGFSSFANPSGQAGAFGATAPSAFGAAAPSTTSAFGTGGSFSSSPSNATPSTSGFGQASGNSAFGSTAPGVTSAFGSSNTPASTSTFGSAVSAASVTSAFGTTTTAPVSAFGTAAPSTFGSSSTGTNVFGSNASSAPTPFGGGFGAPSAPRKKVSFAPDFTSAMSKSYVQGKCPYDSQLPANYLSEILPKNVVELFKAEKFEWGKVPEWIPPLELR